MAQDREAIRHLPDMDTYNGASVEAHRAVRDLSEDGLSISLIAQCCEVPERTVLTMLEGGNGSDREYAAIKTAYKNVTTLTADKKPAGNTQERRAPLWSVT